MRKPSALSPSRIVQLALAILAFSACDRGVAGDGRSPSDSVSFGTGAGANVGGFAGRDEAKAERLAIVNQSAPSAPSAAPAPMMARAGATADAAAANAGVSLGTPIPSIDPTGAMLVRHGQASIEVKGVDDAVTRMRQTAAQFGGFVANTALRTGKDEQRSAMLQLRIPSNQFDGAVAALSQLGKVESVSVNAEDVAEEYVDLGARLANARRVEARLAELLATRTGKLSDVLTVEQELARVRQEAERYEARMRWLERRATLSSLDVSIHEKLPLIDSPRGRGPILEAFAEAWERMVSFVAGLIALLGILVPLGVLVLLGALVIRRFIRGGTPPGVPQS
jgi:Domain of unknown function (DUF4349)